MSCSRKKKTKPPKEGHHQCQACGQVRKKHGKLCKPKKIKKLEKACELQLKTAKKRGAAGSTAVIGLLAISLTNACQEPTPELAGRIAFTRRNSARTSELRVIDATGRNERLLFSNADSTNANVMFPRWRGERIEVIAMKDGRWALWSVAAEGADAPRVVPGETDERTISQDSQVPDLEVRSGELFRSDGTQLSSWRLYDGKLNPGASEASWSPDRSHAVFQTCTASACKVRVARADGAREWVLTRGRQPAWGP